MNFPYSNEVSKKISHIKSSPQQVYLFYGSQGIGKLRAAHDIVRTILNQQMVDDYKEFVHPNLTQLDLIEGKKSISINQVREMSERIWQTSVSRELQKIAIINGIDKISTEGANALLKNLEDSPPQTTFILIASSLDNVLPTIRSRSQLVYFAPVNSSVLQEYLQSNHRLSAKQAAEVAELAHNMPEVAVMLTNNDILEESRELQQEVQKYINGTISQKFLIAKTMHDQRLGNEFVSELSYAIWQQSSILMHGESNQRNSVSNLEKVLQAQTEIIANVSSRTAIENLALQLENN